jgi:lipopolysaccharide transport system ATP-binding protein
MMRDAVRLPDRDLGDSSEPILSATGVGKTYRVYARPIDRLKQALLGSHEARFYSEFPALDDITFEVRRGEAVGLVGRNGAGKSTLLQIISGVLAPSRGEVAVRGRIAPLLELGTSFNPEFTGLENVGLAGSVLGLSEAEIEARREAIIAFADIGEHIAQPVRTYSSGMYARLAFAVAAHVEADILIVDEILSVGDIRFTQRCTRFIKDFVQRGTLLFVTHDTSAVLALCDRAIWLDRGRLIEDGRPSRVINHYSTYMASPDESLEARTFLVRAREEEQRQADAVERELETGARAVAKRERSPTSARQDLQSHPASQNTFSGFDWTRASHGDRRGAVVDAYWLDEADRRVTVLQGGEIISLILIMQAKQDLRSPIIGFGVRNRLGQVIFAWDSSREPGLLGLTLSAGRRKEARFTFRFPYLLGGTYTLNVALADGTALDNTRSHAILDAMSFEVTWSTVTQGLIGVPIAVTFEDADVPEPAPSA